HRHAVVCICPPFPLQNQRRVLSRSLNHSPQISLHHSWTLNVSAPVHTVSSTTIRCSANHAQPYLS
ncbi:hypothetical protein BDZ97DRAFT_1781185, partial [Flammula alnicola]